MFLGAVPHLLQLQCVWGRGLGTLPYSQHWSFKGLQCGSSACCAIAHRVVCRMSICLIITTVPSLWLWGNAAS